MQVRQLMDLLHARDRNMMPEHISLEDVFRTINEFLHTLAKDSMHAWRIFGANIG